jgi:HJR/Mrr/RecB family endonuclease
MMGKMYYDAQKYKEAIDCLRLIFEKFLDAEEAGEAKLLIGKSLEKQGFYNEAMKTFEEVSYTSADDRVLQQANLHREFCNANIVWPNLSALKKALVWISGKKPDERSLKKIEFKDDEIITEIITSSLKIEEYKIPEQIDFEILSKLKQQVTAETLQLERWVQDQARKIEEYIKGDMLNEAYNLAQRIIQRLVDSNGVAPNSVYNALNLYNEKRTQEQKKIVSRVINLQAREFEHEVATWMSWAGYKTQVTQQSHDDGVDVLATEGDEKLVIQCKRWNRPVGPDKIRELAGAREQWNASRALLITTSDFTDAARAAAESLNIEIWNFDRLTKELKPFKN